MKKPPLCLLEGSGIMMQGMWNGGVGGSQGVKGTHMLNQLNLASN